MKLGSKKSTKDLGVVRNKKKSATLQARKSRAGWFFVARFPLRISPHHHRLYQV